MGMQCIQWTWNLLKGAFKWSTGGTTIPPPPALCNDSTMASRFSYLGAFRPAQIGLPHIITRVTRVQWQHLSEGQVRGRGPWADEVVVNLRLAYNEPDATAAGQARWMKTIHLSGAIPLAELPARLVEYMDGWNSAKIKRFCGHGTLWNLSPWKLNWCISKSESERWFHIYSMPRREDESDGHNCIFVPGGETTKLMQPRCFKAKRSQGTHQFMFVCGFVVRGHFKSLRLTQ